MENQLRICDLEMMGEADGRVFISREGEAINLMLELGQWSIIRSALTGNRSNLYIGNPV